MCIWRVVRLSIFVLLVMMTCFAVGKEYVDKRTPDSGSWFIGSRYGRSGIMDRSRHVRVSARRDDRFLTGSRYGKRNLLLPSEPSDTLNTNMNDQPQIAKQTIIGNMDCLYTGVSDLYRCISSKDVEAGSAFQSN